MIEILLDGRFIRDLRFGDSLELEIEPGHHVLTATNKLKSASVEFDVEPGSAVAFETTGIALGGIWVIMTMLGTVAYRVTLEPAK